MQLLLETLALVAYIVGLVLIVRATPRLLFRSYDEVWFMVFATLDIFGALLVFGGILISLAAVNGNVGMKALDFFLLVVVMLITGYMAVSCFRHYSRGVQQISRYAAGGFCLFLLLAALYYIVQLFG
jgi:hypothetical protein